MAEGCACSSAFVPKANWAGGVAMAAILVVDDDPNQLLLLREEFARDGHAVLAAPSGQDALAAAQRAMPDLVIIDIAMPQMDGVELLGKLLALNHHLPVSYKDNFMCWAADAYVVKHSDLRELKDTVRHVLTRGRVAAGPVPEADAARA